MRDNGKYGCVMCVCVCGMGGGGEAGGSPVLKTE